MLKIDKFLFGFSNDPVVLELTSRYSAVGYAVYMKLYEKMYNSLDGTVRNEIRTFKDIAVNLYLDNANTVTEIVNLCLDKGWLKIDDKNCLYIKNVATDVLKKNEIRKKRSAAARANQSPGRPKKKPEKYTEQFIESFKKYVEKINEVFGRNFRTDKLSEKTVQIKAKSQYNQRVKEGYNIDDFIRVMNAIKADEYHEKTKYKHITPEFIVREDKFYKFFHRTDGGGENQGTSTAKLGELLNE